MSDSHQYTRHSRASRPFENRENRDPQPRSSYLRHFQQKEKQEKNQIQLIFKEADSSIENILNNSMSHIDKVIQGIDTPIESLSIQDILKQNTFLKDNLIKMKKILKQKLEAGLTKQREELAEVIGNYISLITKLLQDKEELTTHLKHNESHKCRENQYLNKIDNLKESNLKLKHALDERDEQIRIDSIKLDEFLMTIHQYEEDEEKEQERMEAMMMKIQELEARTKTKDPLMSSSFSDKKDAHDAKIQTLLELLESTEQKNRELKDQIKNLQRSKEELRENYEQKIAIINRDNEQQFLEYEKAVRETLDKKEDCIERLNAVVESLKRK